MPDAIGEAPVAGHRAALLLVCPELAIGGGLALPEAAQLSHSAQAAAAARAIIVDWQRQLAREARTAAEDREVRLLADHIALQDHLVAQQTAGSADPDPLRRLWRLLLDQTAQDPALGLRWLRQLPAILDAHRQQPMAPRAVLLEHARLLAALAPAALSALVAGLAEQLLDAPRRAELERVAATCQDGLREHARWLQSLAPAPPPGADDASFDALCRLRRLPFAVVELRDLLEQELREWSAERSRLARRLDGAASVDELLVRVRVQPASAQEGLSRVRGTLAAVHAHAEEKHLLGPHKLPPVELVVLPAPQRGLLADATPWLGLRDTGTVELWVQHSPAGAPLAELAAAELSNLAARQGIPGLGWLQLVARRQPASLRAGLPEDTWPWGYTGWAADLIEGWPLYAVEMLREQGWDGSLAHDLLLVEHVRHACLGARIDLDLACGRIDDGEAVQRAAAELGLDAPTARLHTVGWLRRPGASIAGIVGALRLFELRRDCKVQWGAGFTLGGFHQALLSAGRVPVDELAAWLGEQQPRERT